MMIHSFRDRDIQAFMNKVMEDLKLPLRADKVSAVEANTRHLDFSGPGFTLRADIRDFGLGDIGFSRLSITEEGKSLATYADHPAMEPTLAPRRDDFLRFHASQAGESEAKRKLAFVDHVGTLKLNDEPQVIQNGVVTTLAKFVVSRPRRAPTQQHLSASM